MQADASVSRAGLPVREILWVKWFTLALLAYWGVFALVAPVMNWDAQAYNVSRLYYAHQHGLFGNTAWSAPRQVFFPWTFDAIHYPFLPLLRGYCLPSYACFVVVLIIVYRLVSTVRTRAAAWWCCLSLLAMPTLIFQAVCMKNDVAVVFAVACWFYAWWLWRQRGEDRYVVYMALALCFGAGAKTTGLPYLGLLGMFTVWHLRHRLGQVWRFLLCGAVFFLLFGSVEIYLNNWQVYHSPLGAKGIIDSSVNPDGLAGGMANFIRWCCGNTSIGIDAANHDSPFAAWMEGVCRDLLRLTGLRNLGHGRGIGMTDETMHFIKQGFDVGSDYGLVGTLAMLGGVVFLFARRPSDPVWVLAATGFACLALTSYSLAWMTYNSRFLVLPFTLLALAWSLWVYGLPDTGAARFVRTVFQVIVVYSIIVYPFFSVTKKPDDLVLAIRHRTEYEMTERQSMLEIVRDLRHRLPAIGSSPLLLLAGADSWTLAILEIPALHAEGVGDIDLRTLEAAGHDRTGVARPVYVLVLNHQLSPDLAPSLVLLQKYKEEDSALYEWRPAPAGPPASAPSPAP